MVTGASSGIGRATVLALAENGATVFAAARRMERLEMIKKAELSGNIKPCYLDITDQKMVDRVFRDIINDTGGIDILVNNAGVMFLSHLYKKRVDEWEQMIDVNIKGLLYGIASVLPSMQVRKSGHIFNICSVAGHKVLPTRAVYSATKYAVRAISEGLRQEVVDDHIRVTMISPGIVETEITQNTQDPEARREIDSRTLITLQPEDIANAIVYAATQPDHVNVNEILIRPTEQRR